MITGVILAGGRSSRMGADKAALCLADQTLLERCRACLETCLPAVDVIRDDDQPGLGPIGGLLTALRRARSAALFVVACDMPFLRADLIRFLGDQLDNADAVAIRDGERFEALHAVYHRRIVPVIERQVARQECSLQQLLRQVRVRAVEPAELTAFPGWREALRNVNTPVDWEHAQRDFDIQRRSR